MPNTLGSVETADLMKMRSDVTAAFSSSATVVLTWQPPEVENLGRCVPLPPGPLYDEHGVALFLTKPTATR